MDFLDSYLDSLEEIREDNVSKIINDFYNINNKFFTIDNIFNLYTHWKEKWKEDFKVRSLDLYFVDHLISKNNIEISICQTPLKEAFSNIISNLNYLENVNLLDKYLIYLSNWYYEELPEDIVFIWSKVFENDKNWNFFSEEILIKLKTIVNRMLNILVKHNENYERKNEIIKIKSIERKLISFSDEKSKNKNDRLEKIKEINEEIKSFEEEIKKKKDLQNKLLERRNNRIVAFLLMKSKGKLNSIYFLISVIPIVIILSLLQIFNAIEYNLSPISLIITILTVGVSFFKGMYDQETETVIKHYELKICKLEQERETLENSSNV